MANHFHLMVEVKEVESRDADFYSRSATSSRAPTKANEPDRLLTPSRAPINQPNLHSLPGPTPANEPKIPPASGSILPIKSDSNQPESAQSLNHSIGVMLSSYTKAINRQNNTSGSLFRQKTKAICLNEIRGITSHWYTSFGVTFMKVDIPESQYPQVCFNYIHHNPVKAGLVINPEDWAFSSYADLVGIRGGSLVNRERVDKLGLICG